MSQETLEWLRDHIRIGYGKPAWWAAEDWATDGTHFPGPVPAEEVRRILDVPLVSAHLTGWYKEGRRKVQVADESRQLIVNKDTGDVLGVFKRGYNIHPFLEWTRDQIAAVTAESRGDLAVRSVGLLRNSAVAFLQVQLERDRHEVNGYGYVPFILAATSCDGSLATTYSIGSIGVVCDNTMHQAISAALAAYKARHSRNSLANVEDIRAKLGLMVAELGREGDEFGAEVERLCNIDVTERDFAMWLDEMKTSTEGLDLTKSAGRRTATLREAKRAELTRLYTEDPKAAPWNGTAFGVLQAANTWATWSKTVQAAEGGRPERNFTNMVTGVTSKDDGAASLALADVLARRGVALAA